MEKIETEKCSVDCGAFLSFLNVKKNRRHGSFSERGVL